MNLVELGIKLIANTFRQLNATVIPCSLGIVSPHGSGSGPSDEASHHKLNWKHLAFFAG